MHNQPFHILIMSQDTRQVAVLKKTLRSMYHECLFVIARNEQEYRQRLHWLDYHLILANFNLPGDLGQMAWILANICLPYAPFIYLLETDDAGTRYQHRFLKLADGRIYTDKLEHCPPVIHAVWSSNAPGVSQEVAQRAKMKHRKLLMQKYESLCSNTFHSENGSFWNTLLDRLYGKYQYDPFSQGMAHPYFYR
jgi:hypothetical protein